MNKLIFLFCTLFFCGSICFGQSHTEGGAFAINAHTGIAGSQVQGDGLSGFDKLNFLFGLGLESKIKSGHSLGFEMNLLQKGSKKSADPENNDLEEYKMTLTYIQVPLYFNYHFTEKISALAGPAIGFLIAHKEEDLNGEISGTPEFNTVEFSGIFGGQYAFSSKLKAEIRLDQSLLPIRTKDTGTSSRLIGKQYNTSIGLHVYYSIK